MQPDAQQLPEMDDDLEMREWIAMQLFARWLGADRDWFSEEETKRTRWRKAAQKAFEVADFFVEELEFKRQHR